MILQELWFVHIIPLCSVLTFVLIPFFGFAEFFISSDMRSCISPNASLSNASGAENPGKSNPNRPNSWAELSLAKAIAIIEYKSNMTKQRDLLLYLIVVDWDWSQFSLITDRPVIILHIQNRVSASVFVTTLFHSFYALLFSIYAKYCSRSILERVLFVDMKYSYEIGKCFDIISAFLGRQHDCSTSTRHPAW